jgi:integrase
MAGIRAAGARQPRIHDLCHTLAARALERCATREDAVARHIVALATYLGHAEVTGSYWDLEASPHLLGDIASAAETLMAGGAP